MLAALPNIEREGHDPRCDRRIIPGLCVFTTCAPFSSKLPNTGCKGMPGEGRDSLLIAFPSPVNCLRAQLPDIVGEIVARNTEWFATVDGRISFRKLNLLRDALPAADAILLRDCFVHLSYLNIGKAIANLRASNRRRRKPFRWWAPTGVFKRRRRAAALSVCYVAFYLTLDQLSFIGALHGIGITPWNPSTGLAMAAGSGLYLRNPGNSSSARWKNPISGAGSTSSAVAS
jgi:hypothetical protein